MKNGYAEFTMHWDDAPLDISWMFADECPAGKHGFLRAAGNEFVFADGAPGRFWGTLINSAACFPPHDVAEKTAWRLAKFGMIYAAAIMFRRHDVAEARQTLGIALRDGDIYNPENGMSNHNLPNVEAMLNCEKHRLEIELPGHCGGSFMQIGPDEAGPAGADTDAVIFDIGEMFRSWRDKYGWIDTAMSKVVYGFFSAARPVELQG